MATQPIDAGRSDALISAIQQLCGPALFRYFGADVRGVDRLPHGAALLVGNHSGGMSTPDTFLLGAAIVATRGLDDVPFGLAHDFAFELPAIGPLLRAIGGVPAGYENARELFERGRKAMVYPGGDVDAFRPTRDRHRIRFGGRKGYARLALQHRVPIAPVVAAGAHSGFLVLGDLLPIVRRLGLAERMRLKTWPVTVSFPWGVLPGPAPPYVPLPTRILIEVLDPIAPPDADPDDPAAVAALDAQVRERMQTTLDALVAERQRRGPWAAASWW